MILRSYEFYRDNLRIENVIKMAIKRLWGERCTRNITDPFSLKRFITADVFRSKSFRDYYATFMRNDEIKMPLQITGFRLLRFLYVPIVNIFIFRTGNKFRMGFSLRNMRPHKYGLDIDIDFHVFF